MEHVSINAIPYSSQVELSEMREVFVRIPSAWSTYNLVGVETAFGGSNATTVTYLKIEVLNSNGTIGQAAITFTHAANTKYDSTNFYGNNQGINLAGKAVRIALDGSDVATSGKGLTATLRFAKINSECDPDTWQM